MRNYRGELAECTTSNLFIVKGGAAITPPLESGLLPGITREFLFDVGREIGVDVRERAQTTTSSPPMKHSSPAPRAKPFHRFGGRPKIGNAGAVR